MTVKKFRFRSFKVYINSLVLRKSIKELVQKHFPEKERYLLTDQIIRATNSIILNIAEGSDRGTDRDFALFLNRSHTSLNEVVACLDLALSDKYIDRNVHQKYLFDAQKLANQITAFRRKLILEPNK